MANDQVVDSASMHLLVVVAQAARGEELRRRLLGVSRGRNLELCLLAPAFAGSGLEYVASDVDPGIGRALERLERSLLEMRCEQVVAARGEVGESDPMLAIDSALVSFDADEIVLVPSPRRDQWAEKQLFERVCERFELPVREIELSEDGSGTHALQVAHSAG
jgi:GABA permease